MLLQFSEETHPILPAACQSLLDSFSNIRIEATIADNKIVDSAWLFAVRDPYGYTEGDNSGFYISNNLGTLYFDTRPHRQELQLWRRQIDLLKSTPHDPDHIFDISDPKSLDYLADAVMELAAESHIWLHRR